MNIKLKTEKTVTLESFNMSSTYGGLLIGEPNEAMNDGIIELITQSKEWGNRKVLLKKKNRYSSKDVLKPIVYKVLLISEPISNYNKTGDASSIVLVWFGDADVSKSINQIIVDGIGELDWDKYAENITF